MKILKRIACGICAVTMCFAGLEIQADADAIGLDSYYVGEYYVVSSGVYGCANIAYLAGYTDEWIDYDHGGINGDWHDAGEVIYVEYGYYATSGAAAGITWGQCSDCYSWINMSYLTPYDEYFAPEPETEPPTEATTTKATTTKATTTKKTTTTTLTTTKVTSTTAEVTAETTETEKITAAAQVVHEKKNNNFAMVLIGAIVILLVLSAVMALLLIYTSRKKQAGKTSNQEYVQQTDSNAVFCSKCGTKHDADAVFCRKCGAELYK